MKKLFLDDIRTPGDVTWVSIDPGPWVVVRSYNEAVAWVKEYGFPTVVSFDHDLGYEEFTTTESGLVVVTNATEEKSGFDFAKWLVELDLDTYTMPANFKFTVHSKNPEGEKNIRGLLNGYLDFKEKQKIR